jgi:uncharacterized protein with HEPN domain
MKTEARQRLLDVAEACRAVARFTAGRDSAAYLADEMLRSAVERKLEIIGEAFRRLEDADPKVAGAFPELRQVVGLRNRIIHGYDSVDDEILWDVACHKLPLLLEQVEKSLNQQ